MIEEEEKWYNIPDAADMLEVSEAYIRLMIRQGVFQTKLVPIKEGSRVNKHIISGSEIELFAEREGKRAPRRKDGRAKCCFYATDEEVDRIKEMLYTSNDPGLAVVASTITNSKGIHNDPWIPPSKTKSTGQP